MEYTKADKLQACAGRLKLKIANALFLWVSANTKSILTRSKTMSSDNKELGLKYDADKPRYDLLPPRAIDELAKVLTFGAKKYAPNSWQAVEDGLNRYRAALLHHTFAIQRGELYDEESGLLHSAHAQCCAAFITELELVKIELANESKPTWGKLLPATRLKKE